MAGLETCVHCGWDQNEKGYEICSYCGRDREGNYEGADLMPNGEDNGDFIDS